MYRFGFERWQWKWERQLGKDLFDDERGNNVIEACCDRRWKRVQDLEGCD